MRHRIDKKSFNRDTKARASLLLALATNVLLHGEIVTTKAKAREAARLVDRCIKKAKVGDLAARRQLHRIFGHRGAVNNLCDRVAGVFATRSSGFTRLVLIGNRRGDNTPMYRLSLVEVLPPTKKSQAIAEKRAAVLAAKSQKKKGKKEKKGELKKAVDSKAAQEAIKFEQTKQEKLNQKVVAKNVRSNTRSSLSGGGRGK
jgi:large subunit ribosomal protein L17